MELHLFRGNEHTIQHFSVRNAASKSIIRRLLERFQQQRPRIGRTEENMARVRGSVEKGSANRRSG